jgi:BirA family biotin operon repressor/biotin-[acetyl-CoA-carboxylase] ligase
MSGKHLTPLTQELRRKMTDAERRLWSHLRAKQLGVQFTRQYQIGNAIADFACRRLKLVVEVDGGQHSDSPTDDDRTREIEAHGYHVIRFWNHDVLTNTDGVLTRIAEEIALARNE